MGNENTNAVAVQATEQTKVTQKLLMDYLKQTNSNLQQNEIAQFLAIATTFNLNPWKREVYPVAYGSGSGRKLSIIVGYEVYLRRADEFPQYDGYETEFHGEGANMCCTCKVFRKDRNRPTGATVFLKEYTQNNTMWNTKTHVMLEKVAIATAMRRAFPSQFNGMPYIEDELPENITSGVKHDGNAVPEVRHETTKEPPKVNKEKANDKVVEAELVSNDPKHAPLSAKKKTDFLTLLAEETKRLGKAVTDDIINKFGGVDKIVSDRELAKTVANELQNTDEVPF